MRVRWPAGCVRAQCEAALRAGCVCVLFCLFAKVGDKPLAADEFWKSVQEDIALAASKDLQA